MLYLRSCEQDTLLNVELFGPVLTVLEYPDEFDMSVLLCQASSSSRAWLKTLSLVSTTSPYALTGAVFARDRSACALQCM